MAFFPDVVLEEGGPLRRLRFVTNDDKNRSTGSETFNSTLNVVSSAVRQRCASPVRFGIGREDAHLERAQQRRRPRRGDAVRARVEMEHAVLERRLHIPLHTVTYRYIRVETEHAVLERRLVVHPHGDGARACHTELRRRPSLPTRERHVVTAKRADRTHAARAASGA